MSNDSLGWVEETYDDLQEEIERLFKTRCSLDLLLDTHPLETLSPLAANLLGQLQGAAQSFDMTLLELMSEVGIDGVED
jgi:hypothetical protein